MPYVTSVERIAEARGEVKGAVGGPGFAFPRRSASLAETVQQFVCPIGISAAKRDSRRGRIVQHPLERAAS